MPAPVQSNVGNGDGEAQASPQGNSTRRQDREIFVWTKRQGTP